MKNPKILVYNILGYIFCIVPASICTIYHFPLWMQNKNSCISLLSVVALFLCMIPLWRMIKECFKTPSAWKIWLLLLLVFTAVEHIIVGLRVIACVAFPTSVIGGLFFLLAKRAKEKEEET